MALPGDNLVPEPRLDATPWLPSMPLWPESGHGWCRWAKGGVALYSYERLENLAGCQMRNADTILPECQDRVAWGLGTPGGP